MSPTTKSQQAAASEHGKETGEAARSRERREGGRGSVTRLEEGI